MKFGNLEFSTAQDYVELLGVPVKNAIQAGNLQDILVSEIDPDLSDTAAFCEKYDIKPENAVNCVIVQAKRGENIWYAACMIPATQHIDVNGIVRKQLDAKKISFAPIDTAVNLSKMEFGAITPIGLPADWHILVDENAAELEQIIIGSGIRKSKLLISGSLLASLPNAKVLSLVKSSL